MSRACHLSHINNSIDFRKYGQLAYDWCGGLLLEIKPYFNPMKGWYLGTKDSGGPVSRESEEFYISETDAQIALIRMNWTQRLNP